MLNIAALALLAFVRPVGPCVDEIHRALGGQVDFEQVTEVNGSEFTMMFYPIVGPYLGKPFEAIVDLEVLASVDDGNMTDITACRVRSYRLKDQ